MEGGCEIVSGTNPFDVDKGNVLEAEPPGQAEAVTIQDIIRPEEGKGAVSEKGQRGKCDEEDEEVEDKGRSDRGAGKVQKCPDNDHHEDGEDDAMHEETTPAGGGKGTGIHVRLFYYEVELFLRR
jgi:hypothetical protein